MQLKRIDVFSCAKVVGILYALMGLLFGGLFSLLAVLGLALESSTQESEVPLLGFFLGAGAIVILPVFYGVMGAITAAIGAALYNVVARFAGGIELELS
jgi:hypothetical protein